jgi:sugar/nucleoside kinase (ribokinase family)
MTLLDACEQLNPEDVPPDLKADCILMGPIANEIPIETCRVLSRLTKCLSLDPQGYLRRFGPEGAVIDEGIMSPEILRLVHVLKASERELYLMTGLDNMLDAYKLIRSMGPDLLIITRGSSGTIALGNDGAFTVPSWPSKVVDPTGAGDAFFGAFLSEYIEGKAVDWCSCVGAASASFVVEGYGPSRFGSGEEVRQRALLLMKGAKKLEF